MTRVAIIAAMPGELKPLVRGWPHSARGNIRFWAQRNEEEEWIAACAGAGQAAATRAFAAIEDGGPIDLVFSIGWVGALTADIAAGTAHNVAGVIDVRTGERFEVSGFPPLRQKEGARMARPEFWLVTSPIVADEVEKRRLAAAYKADLVDMEAAAIARLAQMRGIPFYCIKGVSDGFDDRLPDFNRFIRTDGQFDMARMVLFSILRPWHWPSLVRMGENSRKASLGLRDCLLDFLDERADSRERNGYPNFKH
jgi:adenosylhomocysteine nucleosidase